MAKTTIDAHGTELIYNDDGQLIYSAEKCDGKNHGQEKNLLNGRLMSLKTFKNGVQDGEFCDYYTTTDRETPRRKGVFQDGFEQGEVMCFNPAGALECVESYDCGQKHGLTRHYRDNEMTGFQLYHRGALVPHEDVAQLEKLMREYKMEAIKLNGLTIGFGESKTVPLFGDQKNNQKLGAI